MDFTILVDHREKIKESEKFGTVPQKPGKHEQTCCHSDFRERLSVLAIEKKS